MIDQDAYKIAFDWAERLYHNIVYASLSKEFILNQEDKEIYQQLIDCKWFDLFPLNDDGSEEPSRLMLTLLHYNNLKNDEQQGFKIRSRWETTQEKIKELNIEE